MTTAATSLLGLALPVTGELSGTWGDTVNNQITSLLDSAIAGTTTISTDLDVTLTTTTLASNEARQAILLFSGARTALRTVTAPAHSKVYTVINSTTGGYSVKLVGVGPTTGITVASGESCMVAWNGTDFVKLSNQNGAGIFTSVTDSGLTSGRITYAAAGGLLTDSANLTFNGTVLATPTLNLTNALGVAYGGTGQTSFTDGQLLIGNSVGNTLSKATLTAGTNIAITNGNGTITIASTGSSAATPSTLGSVYGSTATNNTSYGITSGGNITTGMMNTAVGYWAAYNITIGSHNTVMGAYTLGNMVSGSRNTAIGYGAGSGATANDDNTYIGYRSGSNNTGSNNTAVGSSALLGTLGSSTGASNVAIGDSCLYNITTGTQNVAMGYRAGYSSTVDQNNVFVGYSTGYYTTGSSQVAMGAYAMYNMRGSTNTAFGGNAMYGSGTVASNTGTNNVAVGFYALSAVSSGSSNALVGVQAGNAITTGSQNVAMGYQAGYAVTTENNTTYIGYQAGKSSTGATQTAFGALCMTAMLGSNNTAVGYGALYGSGTTASNTGANNVAIGSLALAAVSNGNNNVAVGSTAGFSIAGGASNTFVGTGAGYSVTTGAYNVVIGSFSGSSLGLDIRTSSGNIVLSDGLGNQRWHADSMGATGYPVGSGGTVSQGASRTTGVTLNKPTGAITLVSAAGSASYQTFTVTNSTVSATDTIIVNQKSGTDKYIIMVTAVAAGSFSITFATTGGTTTETPVFSFAVVKGAIA
jgi:hypothetical protein